MDETESDYCLRLLVKAAQYYKEHMKVILFKTVFKQIYHIDCVVLTNNKILESKYNENQDLSVITIATVFSLMIVSFQFVDSISQAYPTIGDYMNTVSIESAENSPAEMEIDPTAEEGMVVL